MSNMDIYIDLNFLTESERDVLQDVLARDEDFRRQEKKRLSGLKKELEGVKKTGARANTSEPNAKVCARCHESLGLIFNSGAFCPKCKARVCKNCRISVQDLWLCNLCGKVRDVKAKSGAWFYEQAKIKGEARSLFGTSLLRASLKREKNTTEDTDMFEEPPRPMVIGLDPNQQEKIHRPIPIRMSGILEAEANDSSYHTSDSADDYEAQEVNENYIRQYAKAVPVTRYQNEEGHYSDKDESPGESSSGCSTPTTVIDASKVSDSTQNGFHENEREKPETDNHEEQDTTRFDYLKQENNSPTKIDDNDDENFVQENEYNDKHLEDSDEFKSINSQSPKGPSYSYNSTGQDHYPLPGMKDEYSAPKRDSASYSQDSLNTNKEWTMGVDSGAGSVDSFQTADNQTPSDNTNPSDFNTPTQSLPSDNDSDFIDARDTTHVPLEENPHHGYTLEETYTDGGKIVPPQIVTTAVDDDIDEHQNDDYAEPIEDIDQAFAEYGVDTKSRSLSDHFEMGSRESIVSYYSEAGEGLYGDIAVTGEVQFGLKYDFRTSKLEIQVHRARDIAPVDIKKNRSDPYIKVYLLPDKTKGGKRKTKTKKNTLNPEFDEIISFNISFDEMLTRSLWMCVWNHDRFGHNDFLGEVVLPFSTYDQSGFSWEEPSSQWYPLHERRPEQSLMEYSGELIIALKYVPPAAIKPKKGKKKNEGGELHVQIKEAHNLKAKDANGFSDPFCKTYLLPDKSRKTKRKTPTIRKNVNPKWNISFVYEHLTIEDLMDRALEVTVWDWDRGTSNDFLGGVRLGMGARTETWDDAEGEEIAAWQKMLDYHNEWNECTIGLRSLPRFPDKHPTESEPEIRSDEEVKQSKPQVQSTEPEQQPTNKSNKNSKDLERKDSEKEGLDNMAFIETKGDREEEKAVNSMFQSFNNFTSKFKFTSDNIDDVEPEIIPKDVVDSSLEEPPNEEREEQNVDQDTKGNSILPAIENKGSLGNDNEEKEAIEQSEQHSTVDQEKRIPDRTMSVPTVKTIVTAPEPEDNQKQQNNATRHDSDNMLFFEGATLSSPDLEIKRRHSTDFVSVPRPLNEELIQEDMKKRGIPFKRKSTKKIPQGTREQIRRESYSPRMERKSRTLQSSIPLDDRRKTLAELAIESGYKTPKAPDSVDGKSDTLKAEDARDKVISAPAKSDKAVTEFEISGDLYLTLEYCQENRLFTVHIHTANNLVVIDKKRKISDPYVKTYLLPDKRSKKKTKTVRDNLNPEFDEIIKYQIGYDELLTRILLLTVWNDDLFGRDDFLGEVVIPLGPFVEQGNSLINSTAKWHKLCEKTDYEDQLTVPEVIIALKYVTGDKVKKKGKKSQPMKGELMIQILEAKNLPGKDADGMSDPFCRIYLLPDKKGKTKHKTPIIKNSLNPSWNYKLEYEDLSTEDLNERVLEITLWDHDLASRDEFLGGVRLGTGSGDSEWCDSTDDEAQIWHTMLNRSNVWIQVVIPLRPTMDTRKNM